MWPVMSVCFLTQIQSVQSFSPRLFVCMSITEPCKFSDSNHRHDCVGVRLMSSGAETVTTTRRRSKGSYPRILSIHEASEPEKEICFQVLLKKIGLLIRWTCDIIGLHELLVSRIEQVEITSTCIQIFFSSIKTSSFHMSFTKCFRTHYFFPRQFCLVPPYWLILLCYDWLSLSACSENERSWSLTQSSPLRFCVNPNVIFRKLTKLKLLKMKIRGMKEWSDDV